MKNTLQLVLLVGVLLVTSDFSLFSQVCTVDSNLTSPGIYPSDTLLDMGMNVPVTQVVQFVFPIDTVIFGQTVLFDSFIVSQVSAIPAGMNWECNANHPECHYIPPFGQSARGCVKLFGMPNAQNAAYPAYDSIIVTGLAFVTIPFVGSQSFAQDIPIYYRVQNMMANPSPHQVTGLTIAPNPVDGLARIHYDLRSNGNVKLTVLDLMSHEVKVVSEGIQRQGNQELVFNCKDLPVGAYLLKIDVNHGESVQTQKFITFR